MLWWAVAIMLQTLEQISLATGGEKSRVRWLAINVTSACVDKQACVAEIKHTA